MDSLFGITFGTSKNETVLKMYREGWQMEDYKTGDDSILFDGGILGTDSGMTYAGFPVLCIYINFYKDRFYMCQIYFAENMTSEDFSNLSAFIKNKYITSPIVDVKEGVISSSAGLDDYGHLILLCTAIEASAAKLCPYSLVFLDASIYSETVNE